MPDRPNLSFTGQVGDIWWVFVLMGLASYIGIYHSSYGLIANVLEAVLSWMVLRWVVSNLASNGMKLPIAFNGSIWVYVGWNILLAISFITVIGWAWVATAWTRWICQNISGTQRGIVFNAPGLERAVADSRDGDRLRFHHTDSVDDPLVRALVRVAIRAGTTR